jgi:beta-lactam-binding protein with PASTA domain
VSKPLGASLRRYSVRTTSCISVGLVLGLLATFSPTASAEAAQDHVRAASPYDCVAQGERTVAVPDVRGKPLRVAIREVEQRGFNVVNFGTPPTDSTEPTARVWAQKPSGGERVWPGACVGFRSGCAAAGDGSVRVPDVRGKLLSVAIRSVVKRGLTVVGYGTPPTDSTEPRARVRAQKPSGGERVWPGACIGFRTR